MKLIKPSFEILSNIDSDAILKEMEIAARTCYKSEGKISEDNSSARELIKKLINRKHEAMLEFGGNIAVKFICDRGVSHELVRHRIASFAQESTRYCNYGKDEHIQFIAPTWLDEKQLGVHDSTSIANQYDPIPKEQYFNAIELAEIGFISACAHSELAYTNLLSLGRTPQEARAVLNNATKTEINVSANIREWKHIFRLRCAKAAHPQMRELMIPLHEEFKKRIPILFDDITY